MKVSPKPHIHQGLLAIENNAKGMFSNIPDPIIIDAQGNIISFLSLPAPAERKALPSPEDSDELVSLDVLQPRLLESFTTPKA